MKPIIEKVPSGNYSFNIKREVEPFFKFPWHQHPEIEIILVEKGFGTRFVGDHIESFKEGDLVMIGTNLPHRWKSDIIFHQQKMETEIIVIHFAEDVFGDNFFNLPEMHLIKKLINLSRQGIKVSSSANAAINEKIRELFNKDTMNKIAGLINILDYIARSDEYELLASSGFIVSINSCDSLRLNKVIEHVMNNFSDDISFGMVAGIANMSESAFSRYFKKHTGKTFSRYLNEIRIGYACKLLLVNKLNMTQISGQCGYNNISYFNKQFKNIIKKTPKEYLQSFHRTT